MVNQVCKGCMVNLEGFDTWSDLIQLDMLDFNINLGMDQLCPYHDVSDYYAKTITLMILEMSPVIFQGLMSWVLMGIISYIQAERLIFVGCLAYLAYMCDMTVESPIVQYAGKKKILRVVPIVYKFSDLEPYRFARVDT